MRENRFHDFLGILRKLFKTDFCDKLLTSSNDKLVIYVNIHLRGHAV